MTREEAFEKCWKALEANHWYVQKDASFESSVTATLRGNLLLLEVLGLIKFDEDKK